MFSFALNGHYTAAEKRTCYATCPGLTPMQVCPAKSGSLALPDRKKAYSRFGVSNFVATATIPGRNRALSTRARPTSGRRQEKLGGVRPLQKQKKRIWAEARKRVTTRKPENSRPLGVPPPTRRKAQRTASPAAPPALPLTRLGQCKTARRESYQKLRTGLPVSLSTDTAQAEHRSPLLGLQGAQGVTSDCSPPLRSARNCGVDQS